MEQQRFRKLVRKLTGSPFFPILFISEAVKEAAYADPAGTGRMGALAVVATALWLYTADDVKWGIYKAKESIEEATDEDKT